MKRLSHDSPGLVWQSCNMQGAVHEVACAHSDRNPACSSGFVRITSDAPEIYGFPMGSVIPHCSCSDSSRKDPRICPNNRTRYSISLWFNGGTEKDGSPARCALSPNKTERKAPRTDGRPNGLHSQEGTYQRRILLRTAARTYCRGNTGRPEEERTT